MYIPVPGGRDQSADVVVVEDGLEAGLLELAEGVDDEGPSDAVLAAQIDAVVQFVLVFDHRLELDGPGPLPQEVLPRGVELLGDVDDLLAGARAVVLQDELRGVARGLLLDDQAPEPLEAVRHEVQLADRR